MDQKPDYVIKFGDIISMEFEPRSTVGHPLIAKYDPKSPDIASMLASHVEKRFMWFESGAIRPWSVWNIPATRCKRIKGV